MYYTVVNILNTQPSLGFELFINYMNHIFMKN